eukprot:TRINITY_DN17439_c0_g1_i3.p1 TRINITY_DN17439_c0_g1~~TRINITY_DN17439_c0_g1_i3.p1  ORF type:complete len:210 (+),score=29.69 TRINITY_DN17439_c0_g1_i3:39-632(+)
MAASSASAPAAPRLRRATPSEEFLCGGFAGVLTRSCIAPLDVLKIRLQVQIERTAAWQPCGRAAAASSSATAEGVGYYSSLPGTLRTIFRDEGVRGFWRGPSRQLLPERLQRLAGRGQRGRSGSHGQHVPAGFATDNVDCAGRPAHISNTGGHGETHRGHGWSSWLLPRHAGDDVDARAADGDPVHLLQLSGELSAP